MDKSTPYEIRTILERILIPDAALNRSGQFLADPEGCIRECFNDPGYPDLHMIAKARESLMIRKYSFSGKYNIIEIDLPALSTDGQGSCERIYVIAKDEHVWVYLIEKNIYWFYSTEKFIASIDSVERRNGTDHSLHTLYEASEEEKSDELSFIIRSIDGRHKIPYRTEYITYETRSSPWKESSTLPEQ